MNGPCCLSENCQYRPEWNGTYAEGWAGGQGYHVCCQCSHLERGLNGEPLPTEAELVTQDAWLRENWT
jgi:hypothetical protein